MVAEHQGASGSAGIHGSIAGVRSEDTDAVLELSVVVPAYCEEQRLEPSLTRLCAWLQDNVEAWEVLVVDDGSPDATAKVAAEFSRDDSRVRLLSYADNRGKGYAVRYGLENARGGKLIFTDADLSTPPPAIGEALALLDDYDLVAGTRARPQSRLLRRQAWYREGMGRIFNLLIRSLGLTRIPDTQCGFKAMRAEALPLLLPDMKLNGFSFDVELLALAENKGLRIAELPVDWTNDPDSRVRIARHSLLMFFDVIALALRLKLALRGRPGGDGGQ